VNVKCITKKSCVRRTDLLQENNTAAANNIAFVVAASQAMKVWGTTSLAVGFGSFFYGVVVQLEDIGRAGFRLLFLFLELVSHL